jgi:4a-hydroxytetrahydrobiopterin dehydratase
MGRARVAGVAALAENGSTHTKGGGTMRLTKGEIEERLRTLKGWKLDDDEIEKEYKFADFKEAMAFVNKVAEAAEAANHHPDIEISYNKVELKLSTHSEGGVTEKDFDLAAKIEAAAGGAGG